MNDAKRRNKTRKTQRPLSYESTVLDTAHLMSRAGFGATLAEVETAAHHGLSATVDQLVNYQQVADTLTPPDDSILGQLDFMHGLIDPLGQWWIDQMIKTSRPFQEKMVLFWHGHFATANYKVRSPRLMYQQNQLFRQNALGRFDDLLTAVYKDPAMLIWLDGRLNVKAAPNENWGREVMELFTLGVGNYSEDDVHANSRAFTGWRLLRDGTVMFMPRLHDDGSKTLLGQTGNWGSDDAVRILCAHPACGPFLADKLWQFFASDVPPARATQAMADAYYSSGHSIEAMVRSMFGAPEFYSSGSRTMHVKSPVDFVVTPLRQLGVTNVDSTTFPRILTLLGQQLFNPPNVGGWTGGQNWVNAGSMLTRFNYASRLTGDAPGSVGAIDPNALLDAANFQSMSDLVYFIANTTGISMSGDTSNALMRYAGPDWLDRPVDLPTIARGLIHLALISPEYQIA